jgi:sugar lactone lactonase YvrE
MCPTDGTGTVELTLSGLPPGTAGKAILMGSSAQTVTMSQRLTLSAGPWSLFSERVVVPDPLVRSVYAPTSARRTFCLPKDGTLSLSVTWEKVATSNRLWAGNGSGGEGTTHGFDSAVLRTSGTAPSSWKGSPGNSGFNTFDKAGNLWAVGNTVSDPLIAQYPAEAFASTERPRPTRTFSISQISCVPAISGTAFDPGGRLVVASGCADAIYWFSVESLAGNGALTPEKTGTGLLEVSGLAFSAAGDLWASLGGTSELVRFDAAALAGPDMPSPTRRIKVRATANPMDMSVLKPDALAFDASGNLYSFDFGRNLIFFVRAADLGGTGDALLEPGARVAVSVGAILESLAFDEEGGLWFPFSVGKLARLSGAQLTVSSSPGAPTVPETVITGENIAYTRGLAFFPAPNGTGLFHALP